MVDHYFPVQHISTRTREDVGSTRTPSVLSYVLMQKLLPMWVEAALSR